ncbi:MAG TPA: NAD(P)-binding domain-containing protein [Candidatus Limnocylindrales bacterium]|nr:NAD(P)-binding domain-containing protein [Candidatus Limnocylindrales bacterium]
MKIAIIGAGSVGGALAAALSAVGHSVVFGVRDPDSDKCRTALAGAPGSAAMLPAEAVVGADLVAFALRPDAVPETVAALPSMDGRVVIDAMNRLGGDPARSTSQDLVELLPGARVIKAFNTIGFENLATARGRAVPAAMFVAGDDPEAKATVLALAAEFGFRAEDAGPLANAKALEEMVRIWLALARQHGRRIGFAISDG